MLTSSKEILEKRRVPRNEKRGVPHLTLDDTVGKSLIRRDELKTKNKTQLIIKDLSSKNLFFFNSLLFWEKREKRF